MHRIRLRGPWEVLSSSDHPEEAIVRVRLPCRWKSAFGEASCIRIVRRFGHPAELSPDEHVWLVIETEIPGNLSVNGEQIQACPPGNRRFDVTGRLNERNRIEVALVRPADQTDPSLPEVWLEIDSTSEEF